MSSQTNRRCPFTTEMKVIIIFHYLATGKMQMCSGKCLVVSAEAVIIAGTDVNSVGGGD